RSLQRGGMRTAVLLLAAAAVLVHGANPADDEVKNLPGVTFELKFKHYAGYLDASLGNHLHYWFFESQSNAGQSPLVLWLNGGPGCSSIGGSLMENGPFRPTQDGQHLQENPFSWNKIANVIYIDSPRGVGYSYRDNTQPSDGTANDTKTTEDLVLALQDFVRAYPQLKFRDFYITGESYAGVYVPQLANALLKTDDVNLSLKGFAVGNGLMNLWDTINSAVGLTYYRGMIGKPRFDALNWCVTYGNVTDGELLYADFSSFIDVHDDGKVEPKKFDDEAMNQCAQAIYNGYFNTVWTSDNRVYNTYTDCYVDDGGNKESKISKSAKSFNNYEGPFVDQGVNQFPGWTDPFGGFPCFAEQAAEFYMNLPEVRDALHAVVGKTQWVNCGDIPYIQNEHDMSDVFEEIINSGKNIRVLVYSGDLDMADSFMANQWFVERLAETNNIPVVAERNQWVFARSASDEPGGSGMIKQFAKDKFTMDLLTVKGAGHQVPMDRPGPALQMISNFIFNTQNYSNIAGISADLAPLLPEFQPTPEAPLSRKEADRIFDLPGLTFEINFNQYAGYLNGVKGNYLHYWLFESQSSPDRDPLVLWLSGGPGCSGYTAALWGSGPYRPNRDGTTLSENVYSWNKVANIFFIDSPRNVGFSFQNYTENNNREYSDSATANDLYVAILDFFDVYPEYHGRPFYIAGESYGGVYGPSTAVLLIDQIVAGRLSHINFAGLAAASALLDQADMFNAAIQYQYYHGVIGKDDYDALQDCCTQQGHPGDKTYFEFCDYTPFVEFDKYGTPHTAKDCSTDQCKKCAELTMTISNTDPNFGLQIGYNAYASCYELPYFSNDRPELVKPYYAKKGFEDQARIVSHESSDSQDAQFCWGQIALGAYLNTPAVQAAIHVRQNDGGEIMPWKGCSDDVAANYEWDYKGEMRPFFDRIIASGLPFKFLIFNGDIDMVCNFISDQWFTERLTDFYNMKVEREYGEWRYLGGIGGYAEKFSYLNVTVDFVTVKGAGHFCALDRPGPTLQVLSSYLHNRPLETKVPADLELAPLKQRYVVEETVGRQKDLKLDATKTRAKRAAKAALPPPPPACNKVDNKIDVLPGLTFDFTGNHFSGYLNAGSGSYLFYWLVEAESDPSNKPLILWLNGGPGCSSLSGLLKAMGPYLTNLDGETLYENIFAWNKIANVLYIESPKDVGFSYQASDSDPNTANKYSDSLTAEDNVRALVDFLNCHDNYKNRKLYITGESYAGVYVPTFVDLLLRKTISKEVTGVDLAGFAIGNGDFSPLLGINTAISLTYFKGFHSKKQFESLARCVPNDFVGPMTYFDWTQYINIDIRGQPHPLNTDESTKDGFCGAEIIRQAWDDVWNTDNDVYDTFSDCYERNPLPSQGDQDAQSIEVMKRAKRDTLGRPMQYSPFIDGAKRLNYQSTDNNGGLQCANPKEVYLNIPEVRKAIHVPDTFTKKWQVCSDTMEDYDYEQQYNDTTPIFKSIFASTETLAKPLRVMFYHGDADMACTFLQGQWFTDSLAKKTKMTVSNSFGPWIYEQINGSALTNPGGYLKSYDYKNKLVTLDLITIKGAGHMVPVDLPGPMMQVMNNFITNVDFNTPIWQSQNLERKPLTAEFLGAPDTMTSRMEADRIYELPGLTYDPNFRQYSGYLQASEGNKLFYWFVESQNKDPLIYTPVVLWLNGGPGCSSIIGMMQENGPFRVNPDQRTLWENVYSWNKAAHVVYIDSPRRVGFSYQNMTENADDKWDDDKTASDAYLAIEEFFRIHPEMKLRDFYTSGESYCGVYVPLITAYLVKEINAKRSTINLKGMMIGNGELSFVQDIRSTPSFGYYHGMTGKTEYDSLSDCCPGGMGGLYCHYDDFINPLGWKPRPNLNPHDQACADKFVKLIDGPPGSDNIRNDDYNLYQDCYALPAGSASESRMNMKERVMMRKRRPSKLAAQQSQQQQSSVAFNNFNPVSTDNNGGFYCYMDDATENYLNQPHVRSAIHVPDQVQRWESCSDTVGAGYKKLYEDMTGAFEDIMSANFDMRALIYNGDVDFVCHFMQAQWFVEALSKRETWQADNRKEWRHRGVIAGYVKQFDNEKFPSKNFRLDLVTVKGAGHYVPMDRPGPALQMISNFLRETQDYSKPVPYSLERKPLLPQYTRKGVPSDVVTSPTDQPTPSLISTVTPSAPPTTTSKTTTTNPPVPTTKTASAFATITSLLTSLLALFALFN
ncbi:hypothetical protein PMAYCL1PPCAC_04016, partial [Pristionchus mayeri]